MGGKPSASRMPDTPIMRDLHQRWAGGTDPVETRIQEEAEAVTSLGAQPTHMVYWTDCIYRLSKNGTPLYTTEESLFGEIHPDDIAGQLLTTLVLAPYERVNTLYVPLAVGNHVDHQIVRNWGLSLKKQYREVALIFYEEYPYSEKEGAVSRGLEFFAEQEPPIQLQSKVNKLVEQDVAAKVGAIRCYHSQISTFWANEAEMEKSVRTTMNRAGEGEPAERFWCDE